MGTCGIQAISKTVLVLINILFMCIGFVVAAFGVVVATGSNIFGGYIEPLFRDNGGGSSVGSFFTYVAISAAVLGCVLFVIAMLGACGACCKNICLLYFYVAVLAFILLVEIAVVIVCVIKWDWVTSQLKNALQVSLVDSYAGPKATDSLSVAWNYAFVTYQCCGVSNSSDLPPAITWNSTDKISSTCCKVDGTFPDHSDPLDATCLSDPTTDNSNYQNGCYESILDLILKYNDYMIGVSIALVVLQVATLVTSIVLARTESKIYPSDKH